VLPAQFDWRLKDSILVAVTERRTRVEIDVTPRPGLRRWREGRR
jgi:hypothetical protein